MNVSAVANHFLTTACFTEGNGCLILQIWPKTHARELISHRKGPLLRLFRQMDIISSYLLNLYLSTHTLVSFSVLSREVTLCRLFRDSRLAMVQRVKCLCSVQPQMEHACHTPFHQVLGNIAEEGTEGLWETDQGEVMLSGAFWTCQSRAPWTHWAMVGWARSN